MNKLSTEVINRVCATPKNTLNLLLTLTDALLSLRLRRAAVAYSSQERKIGLGAVYAITASLLITSIPEATAKSYSVDHLKLYAHSRILDYKEFQCFNRIITKESRWSYLAKNGSHFGLGQMRSKHYRDLDPYRQIDATLKYITIRYDTNCKAWAFHEKKGYY
jgi:hypothetical protein